jgi:DNA polymerase bacteriophage-type
MCFGDKPVYTWLPQHGTDSELWDLAHDPEVVFVAHSASFEKAIWRNIMVPMYGFPNIPNEQWADTQAVCAMRALPLGLDDTVRVLRLSGTKDTVASKDTIALSKPDKRGFYTKLRAPKNFVYSYCAGDVRAEVGLHQRLGLLPKIEQEVWQLDQTVNERGVRIDLDFVRQAQKVVDGASKPLLAEFAEITEGLKPSQVAKFGEWCADKGLKLPDMKKETLARLLGSGEEIDDVDVDVDINNISEWDNAWSDWGGVGDSFVPPLVRKALEIKQLTSSASIKKLGSMLQCTCADGRARGLLQYHGAHTGLWSGRLLQPQNFPRGTTRLDDEAPDPMLVVNAIMSGDHEYVGSLLGPPISVVGSSLRHAIIADDGLDLVAGDFSGIQARIVLALAGQHDKTALMASGADVYLSMAEAIHKVPEGTFNEKQHVEERQGGKNTILGAGFQMGWKRFKQKYCRDQTDQFAQDSINAYRQDWAPEVPKLWKGLEYAACETVWTKRPHEAYGVEYRLEDEWLVARLPNGDRLWYFAPTPCKKLMPWSTEEEPDVRSAWHWMVMKTGHWSQVDAFGGILTQHVVSRLARGLLVKSMLECERNDIPIILNVHDENVGEPSASRDWTAIMKQIMEDRPRWAIEMQVPVAAKIWQGGRYKK